MTKTMRIHFYLVFILVACIQTSYSMPAYGQFGLKRLQKAIEKEVDKATTGDDEGSKKDDGKQERGKIDTAATKSPVVFSKSPINSAKPSNLTKSFKAGDHIYGLIQVEKTWRDLLGKGRKDISKIEVPIDIMVDGKKLEFQYITIKDPKAIDSKLLVLDIAPEPSKMTAYKDPAFFYAEGKGNRKIGPDTYTYNLSELKSGKHTIYFQVRSYGDIFSAGEFTIEGNDYKKYAKLREKILAEAKSVAKMPEAQKVDKQLEATMLKLLENADWKDIRRLVIVDKDWWLDRVEGGNTPIKSRHIAAAVAAKADNGSFFWCKATFHQQKRLDGSFGPLELTHVGDQKSILEKNIGGGTPAKDSGKSSANVSSKDISSTIQKAGNRLRSMQVDQAVGLYKEAAAMLEQLKSADPGHKDLASLQKNYDQLSADMAKQVTKRAERDINPMKSSLEKALSGTDSDRTKQDRDKLVDAVAKHRENLEAVGGQEGAVLISSAQGLIDEADKKLGVAPVAKKEQPESAEKKPSKAVVAAGSGDAKQINSEIERKFRSVRNATTPEMVKYAEEIKGLIEQLRAADPNHNRLSAHEKKVEKMVADAYAADVRNARSEIDRRISRIEMYLDRNQENERPQLKEQRDQLVKTLEEHRAALEAAGEEGKTLIASTKATIKKVDESIGAVLAGDTLADQWLAHLRLYTRAGEKDLTRSINGNDNEAELKQHRTDADKLWAEYQQVTFPNGKTSELERAEEFFKQAIAEADRKLKFAEEARQEETRKKEKESVGTAGQIVFSAKPLDPAKPSNLATSFKAPGHIYSLIQIKKKWTDLLGKKRGNEMKVEVPIEMLVDGESKVFQYIKIKKLEAQGSKLLVLDIAPDPAKMTAYKDSGIQYSEARENRKIGPESFTYILSQLKPGKHTIRIQIRSFADYLVVGDFTIEGEDYKAYAKLHEKIVAEAQKSATMPEAKKTDKALEATMLKLLENAGWTNIHRLVIVDKDWWLDRVSGGNSAIKSRHIAAAAVAKGTDGKFFWCTVTFHQYKQITGAFGPLELTHTGRKQPIEEKNIDK